MEEFLFTFLSDLLPSITSISTLLVAYTQKESTKLIIYIFKSLIYGFLFTKALDLYISGARFKQQPMKYYMASIILNLVVYVYTAIKFAEKMQSQIDQINSKEKQTN